jgi:hypothetical protein
MSNLSDVKQIFESPDGGKTLYAREFGSAIESRRLIQTDNTLQWHLYLREHDWDVLAEENPAILEALNELKVLEALCN